MRTLKLIIWKSYIKIRTIVFYIYYLCILGFGNIEALEKSENSNKTPIIVSVTSYGLRLNKLHYTIKSILRQSVKPSRIVVYLGDDVSNKNIPVSLIKLKKYGLEIEFRQDNLKPHKKYYYAMKENPNAIIITIDDDLIYPRNMIESLQETHRAYPECVVACRAHKMIFKSNGDLGSYNDWQWECFDENEPSKELFATGGGGVLYPPHLLHEDLFNIELMKQLSYEADDVWLKIMEVRNGIPVKICKGVWNKEVEMPGTQAVALERV